ncbi:phosphatase PAP2 family protein [Exiguobacterium aurantiacum]|uniref:Phosphatase PAP2 family protein n=1 Tax=Exiguobacterium aurantiacum TaxID=33987 RepID=A0ABY5FK93_9BACL|nr:phosphatase PAP2 family protein [Exiguobacterium aurantiacum]UTT41947.1 phosphatase PAP2 family protein [Exiguobacterium aurantiacum]
MTPRSNMLAITGAISFVLFSVVVVLGWVVPVDRFVTSALDPLAGPLFVYVTELGSVKVLIGLSFIGMLYFLWRGDRFEAFRLPIVVITTLLVTQGLKLIYGVDRPSIDAALDATTYSFPSGHASGSLALYGLLAVLMYRRNETVAGLILLVTLTLAVSFSRVILNVHYFSDVIGGWLVALVIVAGSEIVRRKQH